MAVCAFRVDASLEIGAGHVMRCLTLADALLKRGARCIFICRPHKGNLIELIVSRGYQILVLPELAGVLNFKFEKAYYEGWLGTSWDRDANDTEEILSRNIGKQAIDWLIVDHYAIDARWERLLLPNCRRILVIDDLANRAHVCDLILNQNLGLKETQYDHLVKGDVIKLMGPRYALVQPEFAILRAKSLARRNRSTRLRRLLISMGGVDFDNATEKVMVAMKNVQLPSNLQVTIVMGAQAPWSKRVSNLAKSMPWKTEVFVGVSNMAEIMLRSDLAIGGAGATSFERCSLGLPSVVYLLAENQSLNFKILSRSKASIPMGSLNKLSEIEHSVMLTEALSQFVLLSNEMVKASANLCDGRGCERLVDLIQGW